MRALALVVLGLALICARPALAQNLMLKEEPRTDFDSFGWTFLILSGTMFLYGVNAFNNSRDSLDEAKARYQVYLDAGAEADFTQLRANVKNSLNEARVDEKRANIALYLTILFGITSYYSFHPEDLPDTSIFVGFNTIGVRHRF